MFTLNYDTCVERACREHGISITTGFEGADLHRRGWKPHLLRDSRASGILLHKLHGSLTWFGNDPDVFEDLEPPDPRRPKHDHSARPTLILGPADKAQTDDPYAWLLNRFHETLQTARTCVVVGFGWRDLHVAKRIMHENEYGLDVIEVSDKVTLGVQPRIAGHRPGAKDVVPEFASVALRGRAIADAITRTRENVA